MKTTIYTNTTDFEALSEEWTNLITRATDSPFFMEHRYQLTWWRYLGNDDLVLITVRTDEGQLVGVVPLYGHTNDAGQRQLSLVGCVDISDYLDLLIDPAHLAPVHEALLECLASEAVAWDKLYLCSLPHQSSTPTQFADQARQRGWQAEVTQQEVCPVLTLADSWDDYLAGIDKKQRHEIRRKIRKIKREADINWYTVESPEAVAPVIDVFFELHQKSDPNKEDFWDDRMLGFFRTFIQQAAEAGWLKMYFLEVNNRHSAVMLCFDYKNEFLLYNSGYDPDDARLSTGIVLTSFTIQDAIRLGRHRYDFLRGDEIYKFRFGAEAEPVYDVEIYRPQNG